ncbi:Inositol 2-dehydrogenase {ECO:0000255/HAMAP-Rule:MF_01671} [Petrimonas mucosa]|jgi:predicted dehydrogenase|uniref:Inositol 2-dehydrogenase n=2 Tax=Petrimonas mucosa TaxID=1642646 RepID=A0A1G4G5S7_9BACT|nr:Inositol 2-dehydrogenase {ECO:0000255/HAMAP-Rule:MF_01671} [Petrimonas mucosa]
MQNRREFIKKMAIGSVALSSTTSLFPSTGERLAKDVRRTVSANSNINIALIGKGGMGTSNTHTALSVQGVKLVGVCDLYDKRLKDAKAQWGNDLFTTKEYKEILSRKDVDAVIIATPDHWHQPIAIEAMNAGKHVYCEKPVIHKLNEGKALIEAQRKTGVKFQVGSQGMASLGNRAARLLVQQGVIGPVNFVDGQFTSAPGRLNAFTAPEDASEETIWWSRFLGNAPKKPFNPQHFFAWRNWKDYGTGIAGDLFVHVLSSIHYIMDAEGPEKVYTTGGLRHYTDGLRDTPDVMLGYFDYPDRNNLGAFTVQLGANYVDGVSKKWGSMDFKIVGSKGTLDVGWDKVVLKTMEDVNPKDLEVLEQLGQGMNAPEKISPREYVFHAEKGYKGGHYDHHFNFINGIRNNTPLTADVLFAVRTAAPALLSFESYLRKDAIQWDAQKLKIKK